LTAPGRSEHPFDVRATTSGDGGPAVEWLLSSKEPAIRFLTRRDVLGERVDLDRDEILGGPIVRALLRGQRRDGGFGGHPYKKWTGAHWRLVSLVELCVPPGHPPAVAAADTVLGWLTGIGHLQAVRTIDGLTRRCASQEGNALAVCSRLGMAADPRVELMARSLVQWQWPDGGWNCDPRATGRRSSFHETVTPMWGLHEYASATGASWATDAAYRAAELFLEHRLFRSLRTGEVIKKDFVTFHYPPYWHYDVLQGLLVLGRMGGLDDERAGEAIDLVVQRQRSDGLWQAGGYWWNPPGSARLPEVVNWGRRGPNEMITLNALRVLAVGRSMSDPVLMTQSRGRDRHVLPLEGHDQEVAPIVVRDGQRR
jgi:hypothetical protein